MIELALVFLLGFLVAGVVWLLALPAFWRRATRLTRARMERVLPLSTNDILADQDRLRAAQGVAVARIERRLETAQAALAGAKAELGARLPIEAGLIETLERERAEVAKLRDDIATLKGEIALRDSQIAGLTEAVALSHASIVGLETQRDALASQLDTAVEQSENRRLALDEAKVQADRAREALAEATRRNAELRAELQSRSVELREMERQLLEVGHRGQLARIRGGEETYQSSLPVETTRQAS